MPDYWVETSFSFACIPGYKMKLLQLPLDTSLSAVHLVQVRFFERVKLERRIKRLQAAAQAARAAGSEPPAANAEALAQAQDDLQVRLEGSGLAEPLGW